GPEDGGAWSDGRASYVVRLSRPGTAAVRVTLGSPRPRGIPKAVATFTLDGAELASRTLPAKGAVTVEVPLPAEGTRGHRHRFDVRTDRFNLAALGLGDDGRDLGAFVQRVELTCGNHPNDLVEYGWRLRWLESYDVVLANSSYTASWMRRFWGQEAGVLHPPVVPPTGRPAEERTPTIVALSRFSEGSQSRRQLEMVGAFAALCDEGLEGWRFVVVGGVEEKGRHYLERVREAAADYPIDIVPDAPRDEVERVLGEASVFWQATGWREDPERHPERFEHFGIALVEAMGAGAVPIVLDGGAAHEVVRDGREGLLWSHETGPGPATRMLVQDEPRRQKMSERARKRADDFSPAAFDRTLAKHLRRLRA